MKKTYYLLTILFLFTSALLAQSTIDSLENLSKNNVKDVIWLGKMYNLTEKIYKTKTTLSRTYINQIIETAENLNELNLLIKSKILLSKILNTQNLNQEAKKNLRETFILAKSDSNKAKILTNLGLIYYNISEFDSSLFVLDHAEKLLSNNQSMTLALIFNTKSSIHSHKGNYKTSIEEAFKAAEIFEKKNSQKNLAKVYNNIAARNCKLNYRDKAIKYYNKAIKINTECNDIEALTMNYINLGVTYKNLDSIDLALEYYNMGLESAKKLENPFYYLAQGHVNIGNILQHTKRYNEAIPHYELALETCRESNLTMGYVFVFVNLGQVYSLIGKFDEAIKYVDSSYYYAKKLDLAWEKSMINLVYSEIYEEQQNYKEGLRYYKNYKALDDSLLSEENTNKFQEIQTKFETNQKENEILRLKAKSSELELTIFYLVSISLFLIVVIVWLIYRKKLSDKKRSLAEEEKKRIHLENEKIQMQIELKNNELVQKAMNIAQLQENNKLLKADINQIINTSINDKENEFKNLIKKIDSSIESSDIWKEFDLRFQEIHGDFYKNIICEYPELTTTELKIISLIKLNLNTKEIAEITNRSVRTIENTRNSIRKKMQLSPNENLGTKILSF